jgi:hypothetical protein
LRSRFLLYLTLVPTSLGSFALAQTDNAPAAQIKGKKVCVADVANSSLSPVFTDNLKERLVEDLQRANVNAVDAVAVTVLAQQLGMSPANKKGARRQKCDYMVLSEVAKAKTASAGQASANPSGRLTINFALFKKGHWSAPLAASSVPFTAEGKDPNPAAMTTMDQVASQVAAAIEKN